MKITKAMIKPLLGITVGALLLVATTIESKAIKRFDWPNGGTCMGGPKDGRFVRDLRFCNSSPPGMRGRSSGGPPGGRQSAIQKCKQSVGMPNFRACMQSGGSQNDCRSQTAPKVKACVRVTLGR